jgi:hypothetical protein
MFIGFGLFALFVARDYAMGTAGRMGPGYFPTYIGAALVVLGGAILVTSLRIDGERLGGFAWRPMLLVTLSFALFGWAIGRIGFVFALFGLIFCGALAGREFRLREVFALSTVLIAGCWALFIVGLELPFRVFWWR